jgi:hypothetical protein
MGPLGSINNNSMSIYSNKIIPFAFIMPSQTVTPVSVSLCKPSVVQYYEPEPAHISTICSTPTVLCGNDVLKRKTEIGLGESCD